MADLVCGFLIFSVTLLLHVYFGANVISIKDIFIGYKATKDRTCEVIVIGSQKVSPPTEVIIEEFSEYSEKRGETYMTCRCCCVNNQPQTLLSHPKINMKS